MYENTVNDNISQFKYDDKFLEVVIIENDDDDRDGYVELSAITQLLLPLVNIRGFNQAVMWANTLTSHKLVKNNKHYVHSFAIGRYLSSYAFSDKVKHPPQYYVIKRLMCDLLIGAQSEIINPLSDIQNQLCSLQECITSTSNNNVIYQPTTTTIEYNERETWKDILRNEHASLFTSLNGALETIKSMQHDLTNKLAFSNDTMLDGFKSIKDIIQKKINTK
jgi:Baculovirus P24 capsid protein